MPSSIEKDLQWMWDHQGSLRMEVHQAIPLEIGCRHHQLDHHLGPHLVIDICKILQSKKEYCEKLVSSSNETVTIPSSSVSALELLSSISSSKKLSISPSPFGFSESDDDVPQIVWPTSMDVNPKLILSKFPHPRLISLKHNFLHLFLAKNGSASSLMLQSPSKLGLENSSQLCFAQSREEIVWHTSFS